MSGGRQGPRETQQRTPTCQRHVCPRRRRDESASYVAVAWISCDNRHGSSEKRLRETRQKTLLRKNTARPGPRKCQGGQLLFFQAEDGIRDLTVTGVQTCALPI